MSLKILGGSHSTQGSRDGTKSAGTQQVVGLLGEQLAAEAGVTGQ